MQVAAAAAAAAAILVLGHAGQVVATAGVKTCQSQGLHNLLGRECLSQGFANSAEQPMRDTPFVSFSPLHLQQRQLSQPDSDHQACLLLLKKHARVQPDICSHEREVKQQQRTWHVKHGSPGRVVMHGSRSHVHGLLQLKGDPCLY